MRLKMILTGDINLMGVEDPALPFSLVEEEFRSADIVFGNLECCLYDPPGRQPINNTAFFAPAGAAGEALKRGAIQAVGIANNVNLGEAPIKASIARLDELGIPHTGAGANVQAARAPVILEPNGLRIGFLQRTSVYWAVNHEAKEDAPGVAVIRGHTAYQLPLNREVQPMNRPGVAPVIMTWADADYVQRFKDDVAALRARTDLVVASFHWGLEAEVLQYMSEIAHAAIDTGADVVMGHGPHDHTLPVEIYKGKPIFYGLGALSFYLGHGGRKHGWVGMIARLGYDDEKLSRATLQFVRQNDRMQIVPQRLDDERDTFAKLAKMSTRYGTSITADGDQMVIGL